MVKIVVMKDDYELQRARSIRLNKEFLHGQMVCSGYKISSFTFISNRSQMSWITCSGCQKVVE